MCVRAMKLNTVVEVLIVFLSATLFMWSSQTLMQNYIAPRYAEVDVKFVGLRPPSGLSGRAKVWYGDETSYNVGFLAMVSLVASTGILMMVFMAAGEKKKDADSDDAPNPAEEPLLEKV